MAIFQKNLKKGNQNKIDKLEIVTKLIDLNFSPSTPMLILQTDVEGLMKLKKTRSKQKLKQEKTKLMNSSATSLDQKDSNRSQVSLSAYEEDEHLNMSDSVDSDSNVSFDVCEISEQVTSV